MGIQISGTQEAIYAQHLHDHARDYFPVQAAMGVQVELTDRWVRNNSQLYRFSIGANHEHHFVYVKVPSVRGSKGSRAVTRPYLIPETDSDIKFQLHATTLDVIHRHFSQLNDPRFGMVRVLDTLPDSDAFVMEEASGEIMRRLLNRASRFSLASAPQQLNTAFNNAGSWLRIFHQDVPLPDCVEKIHDTRSDYVEAINRFTGYLSEVLDDQVFFGKMASDLAVVARDVLPDQLPLGLRFGDFGLTNILVEPDGRVTGIDTMAKWQAPIYEDIAWFLTALKAYNMQSYSQGLAFSANKVKQLEQSFLTGYFGTDVIPVAEIRLYEILRLLERWSAKVCRINSRSGPASKMSAFLINRFFRKTTQKLLELSQQTI